MKIQKNFFPNLFTYHKILVIALPTIMILVCAVQIISNPIQPVYDQNYLIVYSVWPGVPLHFEQNLSCVYLLKIYNFWAPHDLIGYNTGLRVISMIFYLVSGALLLTSMTGASHIVLYIILMTLLYSSRFIFIWNSAELFAGAFLMLILWSLVKKMPFYIVAIFIFFFSFAKADLIFSGGIVGVFLAFTQNSAWQKRIANLCILMAIFILLLSPAFLQDGISFILPNWRAQCTLGQHYATLIAPHQVNPVNHDSWSEYEKFFIPIWGESESFWKTIVKHPNLYLDFIFLSLRHTMVNFCRSFLIFLLPPAVWGLWITKRNHLKTVSILFLSGFIPIMLFSWMHIRYAARFYPLFLFMFLLGLDNLKQRTKICYSIFLLLLLSVQLYYFIPVFQEGHWLNY